MLLFMLLNIIHVHVVLYILLCSPVDVYFASCSHDTTARLWSADLVYPLRIFAGHTASVNVSRRDTISPSPHEALQTSVLLYSLHDCARSIQLSCLLQSCIHRCIFSCIFPVVLFHFRSARWLSFTQMASM